MFGALWGGGQHLDEGRSGEGAHSIVGLEEGTAVHGVRVIVGRRPGLARLAPLRANGHSLIADRYLCALP